MSLRLFTAFCLGVLLSPYSSALDEPATPAAEQHASATFPAVELQPLLQRVAETAKKRFLVDSRVPAMVTIGTVDPKAVSYSMLLTILRNNGLAAFTQEGLVNIVPVEAIRSLPVPTIQHNDDSIPNDEWVTRVVQIQYISAVQLVPILRQMVPPAGQLVAVPERNALVLTDTYANSRRVLDVIATLDKPKSKEP